MPARILVIGSANVDLIMQTARLPAPGQTIGGGRFRQVFGGKGANQAVAAARASARSDDADAPVAFLAAVGDDAPGRSMVDAYAADRIDVAHIERIADTPCGTAMILVDERGENCIAVAAGANAAVTPAVIDAHAGAVADASIVLLQMEIPPAAVMRAIDVAADTGTQVLLNYAPVGDMAVPLSSKLAGLIVNEGEAAALLGRDAPPAALGEALLERGPRFVVLTLGKQGAWCFTADGAEHVQAFTADAVDTTAAGDTFCGALAVGLLEARPLPAAAWLASAAAALACTKVGAQPSIPRRDEIDRLLAAR